MDDGPAQRQHGMPPPPPTSHLARLDIFPKSAREATGRTTYGSWLSLFAMAVTLVLFVSEYLDYRARETVEHVDLISQESATNPSPEEDVSLIFAVTFFAIPCDQMNVEFSSMEHTDNLEIGKFDRFEKKGCRVKGRATSIDRHAGEFHVALSVHSLDAFGHVGFTLEEYTKFNASHKIEYLRFLPTGRLSRASSAWLVKVDDVVSGDDGNAADDIEAVRGAVAEGVRNRLEISEHHPAHFMVDLQVVPASTQVSENEFRVSYPVHVRRTRVSERLHGEAEGES